MCVTREEFTLIFNHRLMLPKYVSDDEGNGVSSRDLKSGYCWFSRTEMV